MDSRHSFPKKTMEELNRSSVEETKDKAHYPVWVILDNVRSMHNVGSVFRTADAFNIGGIMLCGMTPQPPHRDIHKTALGATESVSWEYHPSVQQALTRLKEENYRILAVEQTHNSIALQDYVSPGHAMEKTALIFGNEVSGVSDEALAMCAGTLEIPQWGSKHSLNIAVSAGIVLWELLRRYF